MIKEGVLENPKPEAVFGLHVTSGLNIGMLAYRAGAAMAGADTFRIIVKGRQTHGARPWQGIDPIVIGALLVPLREIKSEPVQTAPRLRSTRSPGLSAALPALARAGWIRHI